MKKFEDYIRNPLNLKCLKRSALGGLPVQMPFSEALKEDKFDDINLAMVKMLDDLADEVNDIKVRFVYGKDGTFPCQHPRLAGGIRNQKRKRRSD